MKFTAYRVAVVLLCLGTFPSGAAIAKDAVVIVTTAGEAYQGQPRFKLLADGQLIGERTLSKSIDTTTGQTLSYTNWRDHLERFQFSVPTIERVGKLDIQFVNDASAGSARSGDRGLLIFGVSIDGYRFRPLAMTPVPAKSGRAWRDHAKLWSNGLLRLHRPETERGWKTGYRAASPSS